MELKSSNASMNRDSELIQQYLDEPTHIFPTTKKIKRWAGPKCQISRQRIGKILRAKNYRYKNCRETFSMKMRKQPPISETEIQMLRPLFKAILDGQEGKTDTYFMDQFKMPLAQNPQKTWMLEQGAMLKTRDVETPITLTCNMITSHAGVHSYQIFQGEIRAKDVQFFLVSFVRSLDSTRIEQRKSVRIILDQASWQTAKLVRTHWTGKMLLFNSPRRLQFNLIELYFLCLRKEFEARDSGKGTSDELHTFSNIVCNTNRQSIFKGFCREIVRTMIASIPATTIVD